MYASIPYDGLSVHEAQKYTRLRRMQWFATSLLAAMLVLLMLTAFLAPAYPWLRWVQAFAEAAVVGAVADWFAVVALFRHPLGLPIPHTAIIPRNKDDIGVSIGQFVELNFLTPQNVMRRLAAANLAHAGAQWLASHENSTRAAHGICGAIPRLLDMIEDSDVRRFFERTVLPLLGKLNLSRAAGELLAIVTAGSQHQPLLDKAFATAANLVAANRNLVLQKFGETSRYTPAFLDAYIVDKFVTGIVQLLYEASLDRQHPLRRQFDETVGDLIEKLKFSAEFHERGESIMLDIIEHLQREPYYRMLWTDIERKILADVTSEDSKLQRYIARILTAVGVGLLDDAALQQKLNTWLLSALEALMLTHRHQISSLITDIVRSWDAKEISKKVELEIGKDLQYIRINGTLVGGAVGVGLHALTSVVG